MKRLLLIFLILALSLAVNADRGIVRSVEAFNTSIISGGAPAPVGGGGYSEEETDDMTGELDPPTGWVESSGDWEKTSGYLIRKSAAANNYIRYGTAMGSADHYVCITIGGLAGSHVPGVSSRMTTNTGDEYYIIRNDMSGNNLDFRNCSGSPASCNTFHQITSYTDVSNGDVLCMGIEGTNANTKFYFWVNPGAVPPDKASADYKICEFDNDATCTDWTAAPDAYANTGTYIGVADMHSTNSTQFDSLSAGSE